MEVQVIEAKQLPIVKNSMLELLRSHGDKRITLKGIRWLARLSSDELEEEGNSIIIATDYGRLIGILAVARFGLKHSFIAVHKRYRKRGIAQILLKQIPSRMDRFYAKIALDNIPSLLTSFSMGMVALQIEKGPTGKPTFIVAWGNWTKDDLENFNTV
ncbi:GNAT family N-acetyltransferase [Ammoniphilus sp. 3BR4]|uniref:GNAT family N-acetyltransferase n=1 Tax=Ammoniphilus sp. 3BR4 TaxID=3158265 RepID=UPI0034650433